MSKRFIAVLEMGRKQGIEVSAFCYTVVSSPYLVRMDLVVPWSGGVCRTFSLPVQCLIFPFKTHSSLSLSLSFVSTIFPPNASPHKETHECNRNNHRECNDSALQGFLVKLGTRVRQAPHTETGAALGSAAPMHQRIQTVPKLHTASLLHAATIVPRVPVESTTAKPSHW